jgi:hypothetical protein
VTDSLGDIGEGSTYLDFGHEDGPGTVREREANLSRLLGLQKTSVRQYCH